MSYNVFTDASYTPVTSLEQWSNQYKDRFIASSHDQSMLSLATPDDAVLIAGPPRLASSDGKITFTGDFHIIGFVNSLQYSEQSQVQPLKAIGSRRHVFSRTNSPVNGSIAKLMALGPNLLRSLYAHIDAKDVQNNSRYSGNQGDDDNSIWFDNLEEDLYRIPFGLGVIYFSPGMEAKNAKAGMGAEYFESTVLVNRSVAMQSGQAMIMENVSFMADRVVPLTSYNMKVSAFDTNPLSKA